MWHERAQAVREERAPAVRHGPHGAPGAAHGHGAGAGQQDHGARYVCLFVCLFVYLFIYIVVYFLFVCLFVCIEMIKGDHDWPKIHTN